MYCNERFIFKYNFSKNRQIDRKRTIKNLTSYEQTAADKNTINNDPLLVRRFYVNKKNYLRSNVSQRSVTDTTHRDDDDDDSSLAELNCLINASYHMSYGSETWPSTKE